MRVIIAGGRDYQGSVLYVASLVLASGFDVSEVVSGACRVKSANPDRPASGGDLLGELFAARIGVPVKRFYADLYGKWPACGPRRNAAMADYADALIALPGDRGTANMITEARKRGLKVFIA